jgi:hypothetical protein
MLTAAQIKYEAAWWGDLASPTRVNLSEDEKTSPKEILPGILSQAQEETPAVSDDLQQEESQDYLEEAEDI